MIKLLLGDGNIKVAVSNVFDQYKNLISIEEDDGRGILIVSDDVMEYGSLNEVVEKKYEKIIYILSKDYDMGLEKAIQALCDSNKINMVPSKLSIQEKVEKVQSFIMTKKSEAKGEKVVTFFSPVPNIGTTSTTLSVGKALSKMTTARVGILNLNAWDDGTDQLNYKGGFLDAIKDRLKNLQFNTGTTEGVNEFLSNFHMEIKDKLYILGGNREAKLQRLYSTNEIQQLLSLSKEVFDLVLIDAGSHFDNAAIVQALKESDMRYLIVNQQSKCIRKFKQTYEEILYPLGYKKTDFMMVVNQYKNNVLLPTPKHIYNELSVPLITTIEYVRDNMVSEFNSKSLYDFEDISYSESINALTRAIAANSSFKISEDTEGKKSKWNLFKVR